MLRFAQHITRNVDVILDEMLCMSYVRESTKCIQGEKSRKDMASSRNLVSTIRNIATNVASMLTRTCRLFSIVVTSSKYVSNFDHKSNLT